MNESKLKQHDGEIVRRYEAGENAVQISVAMGFRKNSIHYRLFINGVKIRSRGVDLRGKPKSESHKRNLSQSRIQSGVAKGPKNPNWQGGVQSNWAELKNSSEYKIWRDAILKRDNYTCQGCGDTRGHFHLHHILPRRDFPHLVFSIKNGITLCRKCHEKTMGREYNFVALLEKTVNSGNPTSLDKGILSQAECSNTLRRVQRLDTVTER